MLIVIIITKIMEITITAIKTIIIKTTIISTDTTITMIVNTHQR